LDAFETKRSAIHAKATVELGDAAKPTRELLEKWKADQAVLEARLKVRRAELEAQGLKVQVGAVQEIATRLNAVKASLSGLRTKREANRTAITAREKLLAQLHANRDSLYQARRATLKRIADAASASAESFTVRVFFERQGMNEEWARWLTNRFGFRSPRVNRLVAKISPYEFSALLISDLSKLAALVDDSGPFFTDDMLKSARKWQDLFALQTMRLEDRPRIEIQERGSPLRRGFDHLSAGQQRSILLGLLLCAERNEPLILDQPEDHLDSKYIASAVVRHLESAKERRQVIIATHSANLTVLGDAELVIPMRVENRLGRPYDAGAVDRPATRDQVCSLLEGGVEAYRKRGLRYGFRFAATPEVV